MLGRLFGRRKTNADVPAMTEVLLTKEVVDDPDVSAVIAINTRIVNHFTITFGYFVHELPRASIESYSVDFYMAQVHNGGHEQFAHNANGRPNTWTFARSGLIAMGATEHLEAFDRFETIIKRNDMRARNLIKNGGFGSSDPEVEEIDDVFYAAEAKSSLANINGQWLKSRPNLFVLPASEMQKYVEGFGAHPGVHARTAGRQT